jgi:hypothetical protein
VRYYFAFIGIVMLVAAAGLFLRRAALALRGAAVQGWIEDFDARTNREGTTYFPVVAFVDEDGRRHRFTAAAGRQARRPDVGTLVTVRYFRENPDAACIQSFLQMWAAPLGLALLGSGALLGFFKAAR